VVLLPVEQWIDAAEKHAGVIRLSTRARTLTEPLTQVADTGKKLQALPARVSSS
jgi:hypothetical protein